MNPAWSDDHLSRYLNELTRIFKHAGCKHEAHRRSHRVLEDIAADGAFLTRVLRQYLLRPEAFNARNYPVVGIDIELNADYHLVANCWIPLPGRQTNISSKAIHHHGHMLLTTLSLFGPGYEHWLFTEPEVIDPERELYAMELVARERHELHNIAFVDAWKAHLPVYPERLSITLCLWSNQMPTTWKDQVKRVPLFKQREEALRRWAIKTGLANSLDLKLVNYFDFYPTADGFRGMRERQEYVRGPNEDHLRSVFHTIQNTGNEELAPLIERRVSAGGVTNPQLVHELLQQLLSGRPIEGRLSDCHLNVPHATFTTQEIERSLEALKGRSLSVVGSLVGAAHGS